MAGRLVVDGGVGRVVCIQQSATNREVARSYVSMALALADFALEYCIVGRLYSLVFLDFGLYSMGLFK